MENVKIPIKFDIYEGETLVRTEILTEQTIKIGKLSSSHVRIDDEDVSRMHAVVEVNGPEDVVVLDLGSASGTFVNGQKVTRQRLRSGDELRFGRVRVVVHIAGQKAAALADDAAAYAHTQRVRPADLGAPARRVSVRKGPAFDEEEVEADGRRALEVLVMWGATVLDVRHFTEAGVFTIGEEPEVNQFVSASLIPQDPYPLALTDGHEMVVHVPDGVYGEVMLDGQVYSLEDLKAAGKLSRSAEPADSHAFKLPARARCRLQIGHLTFLVNNVPAAKAVAPASFFEQIDRRMAGFMAAAVLLHALFFGVVYSIPAEAGRLSLDGFDLSDRWVEFILKPETEKEENLADLFEGLKDEGEAKAKAKDSEGQLGKKDAAERNRRLSVEGPKDQKELELARERARLEALRTADAAFEQLEGDLSAVWATNDRAVGSGAVTALGGMFGDKVGEAAGFNGLGVAGVGRGGGGFSEGSIGVGGINTAGRGGGGKAGSGYGRGVSRYGERKSRAPKVIPGKPIISGSLDREIIRRIIRQHRAEYQYCYEKELQTKRDLNGKIVVKFTIAGDGDVIQASVVESTMGNAAVERCLVSRIRRWAFPAPKGGGIVVVNYPFVFKPS